MRTFIKILLIILILGYGGLKAYVWYDVNKKMDDIAAMAAPFAEITHGAAISSIEKGIVGVEEIVIRSVRSDDVFTIQEISFSAPTILDLLFLSKSFNDKEIPEHVGVKIKKLRVNLNSEVFSMIESMSQPQGAPSLVERIDALGCGDVGKFGRSDFVAMGYNPIVLDLAMNMDFKKDTKEMKVDLRLKDHNLYDLKLALQFLVDPGQLKSGSAASEQAISEMSLNYTDKGYFELRNKYCSYMICDYI